MSTGTYNPTDGGDEPSLQERRQEVVQRCMKQLMSTDPQLYYQSAATIAYEIHAALTLSDVLDDQERDAVRSLKVKDIELLLAFK